MIELIILIVGIFVLVESFGIAFFIRKKKSF